MVQVLSDMFHSSIFWCSTRLAVCFRRLMLACMLNSESFKCRSGPMFEFIMNHNLSGFFGVEWISQVMSAIIASERCFCVVSPLRSQSVLSTRTMAVIIVLVFIVVLGLYFVVAFRYRIVFLRPHHRRVLLHGRRGRVFLQARTEREDQPVSLRLVSG